MEARLSVRASGHSAAAHRTWPQLVNSQRPERWSPMLSDAGAVRSGCARGVSLSTADSSVVSEGSIEE